MVQFDWGGDEAPNPLAPAWVGGRVAEPPDMLPEVLALVSSEWEMAPDAPFLAFLPAVWPRSARTWVPDRATRYQEVGSPPRRIPWYDNDYGEAEIATAGALKEAGVPPGPTHRLWLLRPASGFDSLDAMLSRFIRLAETANCPIGCHPDFVELVADDVTSLFATTHG